MRYRWLLGLMCAASIYGPAASAQSFLTRIAFDKEPKGVFSFLKKWDYPWDVVKKDSGKFEKTDGDKIEIADTVHLYFTANCETNVQGGYNIRYCYATKKAEKINLTFSDGLPAYASEFNVLLEIIPLQK